MIHPAVSLGVALILTGIAWSVATMQNPTPNILWGFGLAAIGYSIHRIYSSLRVVENVALTSEEAAFTRQTDAFKIALAESEEKRKPKLVLEFRDGEPPLHVKPGKEITIKFSLQLEQGDVARKPIVYFFAPPGFDFPGMHTWEQDEIISNVGGYITTQLEIDDCRRGITPVRGITLKATSHGGSYSLCYRLTCEGFDSATQKFEIVVE